MMITFCAKAAVTIFVGVKQIFTVPHLNVSQAESSISATDLEPARADAVATIIRFIGVCRHWCPTVPAVVPIIRPVVFVNVMDDLQLISQPTTVAGAIVHGLNATPAVIAYVLGEDVLRSANGGVAMLVGAAGVRAKTRIFQKHEVMRYIAHALLLPECAWLIRMPSAPPGTFVALP